MFPLNNWAHKGLIIHDSKVLDCHAFAFKPLHAKFFRESINMYKHFVSYLHIDMTQVVEILSQIRQEPTYST